MRTIRALTATVALLAAVPAAGEAQIVRPFKDSWYWGGKAGTLVYSTWSTSRAMAPIAGVEWLITRTHAGLYISYAHAFYDRTETISDGVSSSPVDIANLRRGDIAVLVFPGSNPYLKPYAGFGLSMNQVAYAQPQGTLSDDVLREYKTSMSPLIMAGLHLNGPLIAIFGQASVVHTGSRFYLHGSTPFNMVVEGGARINLGSAIDRF